MKKLILIVAIISILLESIIVCANEPRNIESFEKQDLDILMINIVDSIISRDSDSLKVNSDLFYKDIYNDLLDIIDNGELTLGQVSKTSIEFTYPNNSSTEDTVIMVNTKVMPKNQNKNLVYLFEFHVDASGKIYGYNIWAY